MSNFLSERLHLPDVIDEAHRRVLDVFGSDALGVRLEVFVDPDGSDSSESLFMLVRTALGASAAVEKLTIFEEWWLDNINRADNLLTVDVEFE